MTTFGERLRKLRQARKLTQQELAERSGVPYMTIYRVEKGINTDILTATSVKLARALSVSLDVLAGVYEDTLGKREPALPDLVKV